MILLISPLHSKQKVQSHVLHELFWDFAENIIFYLPLILCMSLIFTVIWEEEQRDNIFPLTC